MRLAIGSNGYGGVATLHLNPRGPDDQRLITAGGVAGQSRRRRFPPQCGGGRNAVADGDRSGRPDWRRTARALRRTHHLSQRLLGRSLDTRLGSLQLVDPLCGSTYKLRQGSYFPSFLEPRKTSEKALVAVIQEAQVGGVSTRRVDDLMPAMGLSGISKSTVSKPCKERAHERLSGSPVER